MHWLNPEATNKLIICMQILLKYAHIYRHFLHWFFRRKLIVNDLSLCSTEIQPLSSSILDHVKIRKVCTEIFTKMFWHRIGLRCASCPSSAYHYQVHSGRSIEKKARCCLRFQLILTLLRKFCCRLCRKHFRLTSMEFVIWASAPQFCNSGPPLSFFLLKPSSLCPLKEVAHATQQHVVVC